MPPLAEQKALHISQAVVVDTVGVSGVNSEAAAQLCADRSEKDAGRAWHRLPMLVSAAMLVVPVSILANLMDLHLGDMSLSLKSHEFWIALGGLTLLGLASDEEGSAH